MKKVSIAIIATLCVIVSACATRTATTTAPAGPVTAATTERGVIPEGTSFAIRTNETITSDQAGQTFSAQVEQDIMDQNGRLLVPKGSPATLAVVETQGGGPVGTKNMELAIRSITVRGRTYNISTEGLEQQGREGLGRNRRTAEMVGGGALLGTVIGAVAGGGKGAAVGAAIGAAGGAATQVLTRGKEVRVPAESVLTFRLDRPWRLVGFAG